MRFIDLSPVLSMLWSKDLYVYRVILLKYMSSLTFIITLFLLYSKTADCIQRCVCLFYIYTIIKRKQSSEQKSRSFISCFPWHPLAFWASVGILNESRTDLHQRPKKDREKILKQRWKETMDVSNGQNWKYYNTVHMTTRKGK